MIALEQARQHLETLGLKQAVEALDNTLDVAANKQLPIQRCWSICWALRSPPGGSATSPPGPRWPTSPSSAPWTSSTSPFSPPSTSDRACPRVGVGSGNWPTWPSSPRPPTSCSWVLPAWARPISACLRRELRIEGTGRAGQVRRVILPVTVLAGSESGC